MKKLLSALYLIFLTVAAFSQNNGRISGTVLNKNNQQSIIGISIQLSPGNQSSITDSNGNFRIEQIKPGSYSVKISGIGFQTKTISNIPVSAGNENTLSIELERDVTSLTDITVRSRKNTAKATTLESPLSIQKLTTEDIKANPGGNFDISKVIQSLPGVGGGAAGGSFRNDIIIRGGAPSENVFYLDGIEVPVINHFSTQGSGGGPQGILNVSFIEEVKLSTSAFDARYDNALSSVFQFKQKNGNKNQLQGNVRLSGTEVAATFDGPLTQKTTFLASARKSYLDFLFKALDLPIRPNYWDFQFKTNTLINKKTTLTTIGIGAIDHFSFGEIRKASPEKLYIINSSPLINQWNYTLGATLKHTTKKGYWNLSLSRNTLNNQAEKYEDNDHPSAANQNLNISSNETENKLRYTGNSSHGAWSLNYGASLQYIEFTNGFAQTLRKALTDSNGAILQPAILLKSDAGANFLRYGAFFQAGRRMFNNRLALSAGIRIDANNQSNSESNPLQQSSPRISISYAISRVLNFSSSFGIYHRLPAYTQLAYNGGKNPGKYIQSTHYVAGFEYLPSSMTRFTLEGFYKAYRNYPISVFDGISLANKGTDFGAVGNEAVQQDGKGRAYGFEFFAQQKLARKFFGVFSYTFYRSEFTGKNGLYVPASWDNRHLISFTGGYKMKRNWEIGLKFRYQGAAPYTPFDENLSRLNYLSQGTGIFDYSKINTLRLPAFHAADLRVDKKWNLKKTTLDLFLDIQNLYGSQSAGIPNYTFKRNEDNTAFITTNGAPLQSDGSNAIPFILKNVDGNVLPTIGFIVEF